MPKTIIYLGGYYQAEHSMRISFSEHDCDLLFAIDDNPSGICYWYNITYREFNKRQPFIRLIPESKLKDWLQGIEPDAIIQRYYLTDPVMHFGARDIAAELGIPYILLKMETTGRDHISIPNIKFPNADVYLYAHPCDRMFFEDKKPHAYFYPYGVSSWERSLDIPKTKNIGCFGYYRNIDSRIVNLEMYLREIEQCEEKLHVYGDTWKEYQGEFKNVLKIHPAYSHNDTVTVMNEHKIAVNVETMWQKDVDGGLSHKLWQSIGCGIVTITNYKKSLEDIFYGSYNPVFGHPFDIAYKINHFLNDEDDLKIYGYMGEKFIHEHCEWYPRFESIMKRERIW